MAVTSRALLGSWDHRQEPRIAHRAIAPGLFATLVIDLPDQMFVVTEDMLAAWHVRFDVAYEIAVARLEAASDAPFQELVPGLWAAPWSDSYAAARLLLPDLIQEVCASPLIAIPDRNTLLVADPAVPESFDNLVAAISQSEDPKPITRRVFRLEGESLHEIVPPATAAGAVLSRMILDDKLEAYEREKETHAAVLPDANEVLIRLKAYERTDETMFTTAAWTQGVEHGLLPPADIVTFVEGAGNVWPVAWSHVVAEPSLVAPADRPLPRGSVQFPSPAWLAQHSEPI
jgi:hypothetical protein